MNFSPDVSELPSKPLRLSVKKLADPNISRNSRPAKLPFLPESLRTKHFVFSQRSSLSPALLEQQAKLKNFRAFIEEAWKVTEPEHPFVGNWHIDAICEHLTAVSKGQIKNLLINIPPGCMKSYLCSVLWPAWEWTEFPYYRYLCVAYEQSVSTRDNKRCRDLITSHWYQELFPSVRLDADQNQKTRYNTTAGGWRISTTTGGRGLGEHPHRKIVDDPHNTKQSESVPQRQQGLDFFDRTLSTRGVALDAATIVIMQRLHLQDLSGHILESGAERWTHLCLPMEYEPGRMSMSPIGWQDPRTERGELLWPNMFTPEKVDLLKATLGSYASAGQLQQRPSPQEGGLVKRHWWRFWHYPDAELPPERVQLPDGTFFECPSVPLPMTGQNGTRRPELERILQSWDMSFKDKETGSFVVGLVIGSKAADRFILDIDRRRIDFSATLEAVRAMTRKWPEASEKLVEDKANGPAVISALRHEISGIIEVEPQGGKEARAQAVLPVIESGNTYLPHPAIAPWVRDYIEEWAAAPNGDYWDQIDATSQALIRLQQRKVFFFT